MLSAPSQLLERNIDLFDEDGWLVINPADAYFTDRLSNLAIDVLHQYFDIYAESVRVIPCTILDSRDILDTQTGIFSEQKVGKHQHFFAPFLTTSRRYRNIVIYLPKAKAHYAMLITMAAALVQKGGCVYVVGENKGGIKSASKLLASIGEVDKVDSARHCSLLKCEVTQSHPDFDIKQFLRYFDININDQEATIASLPGVFSHEELDDGTQLLLEKLPSSLRGSVLDFACGAGIIGCLLKKQLPHLDISYLDVSALALYSTAQTLTENGLTGTLMAANGLHGVDERFNYIVTNPPFHTGIKTDYTVTKRFIADAARLLPPGGDLHMVANRFLPYPGLLGEVFERVQTLAQTTRFTVYQAVKS
ncbi:methyltransferase [Alteromonas ponticola]|uniref:Ribosomal RNA small subunit methyltransferase C n=1 Tax=Alteromonas aquimaris TaxID=2998417 RepID=A0ABT3PAU0_9ALTE|nr:methyltransferase [Alteromonas aquimaris]MCW8109820.1 methyltransferase [Alteromonas aquimaris]